MNAEADDTAMALLQAGVNIAVIAAGKRRGISRCCWG
jgi:hypothetical protein